MSRYPVRNHLVLIDLRDMDAVVSSLLALHHSATVQWLLQSGGDLRTGSVEPVHPAAQDLRQEHDGDEADLLRLVSAEDDKTRTPCSRHV